MIWRLAASEWRRFMRTPLAWVLLALAWVLFGWQLLDCLQQFSGLSEAKKSFGLSHHLSMQLFGFAAVFILFITPILTMRQFSEAFRDGSYPVFSSAPLGIGTILLGKYLGVILYQLSLLAVVFLLVLSPQFGSNLDLGLLASAGLGLILICLSFSALGLYFSCLSNSPGFAAAGSYGLLLIISLLGHESNTGGIFYWFSWPYHYLNMQLGLIKSSDLAYFILLSLLFLGLAAYQLNLRYRG